MDACNNMHPGAGPGVSLWQASRAQPLMEQPSHSQLFSVAHNSLKTTRFPHYTRV